MKADLYNLKAEKIGLIDLPDRIFGRLWNIDLIHQALRTQTINSMAGTGSAKGRGEVSGGGKKPWRQKGTGRARHGSIRSPIWKGGGVTHGPTKEKVFKLKLNKKMRQGAIFSILSYRLNNGDLRIVDSLEIGQPKTKMLKDILLKFSGSKTTLLIAESEKNNIQIASKNISGVKSIKPYSLNVYDLLKYKNILLDKNVVVEIDKYYHAVK
jgi:large subunit ribosomal protein L4